MNSVITHNLVYLLMLGAFGKGEYGEVLLPMSPHKWRKLVDAATELNVLRYIADGVRALKDTDVPPILIKTLASREHGRREIPFEYSTAHLFNHWTEKRLNEVREEEMNGNNTSDETLILLDFIVKNAEYVITKDTNVDGIVTMGRYVREHQKNIDYNKLQLWLSNIGMVQIASMEGNMLVSCMHFSPDELPFVIKPFRKARRLFMNPIINVFKRHGFNILTRMNVAMLETVSHSFVSAISLVTDIEE